MLYQHVLIVSHSLPMNISIYQQFPIVSLCKWLSIRGPYGGSWSIRHRKKKPAPGSLTKLVKPALRKVLEGGVAGWLQVKWNIDVEQSYIKIKYLHVFIHIYIYGTMIVIYDCYLQYNNSGNMIVIDVKLWLLYVYI